MSIHVEILWALSKRLESYEAELLTIGEVVLLNLRRNGQRVSYVSYASRADALTEAENYRMGLTFAGWSDPGLRADSRIA